MITKAKFKGKLVSDADEVGIIQKRIIQNLYDNPIAVCDVSGKNPNVMFELGMRLGFDKPTIIIKDDKTKYSFDTSPIEYIEYPRDFNYEKIKRFKEILYTKIKATFEISISNPLYTTFLKHFLDINVGMKVKYLIGTNAIYANALDLYKSAERSVKVLQFFGGPRPPKSYAEDAAKILLEKRNSSIVVEFKGYLAIDKLNIPSNFHESISERFKVYETHGIGDLVKLHTVEIKYPKSFGFDMFIVDNKHAHLSFITTDASDNLQRCIVFENQEKIVSDLEVWFNESIGKTANLIELSK